MSKPTPPTRWFSPWRTSPPQMASDPADLGTAFGLDLSLNEIPHEPAPSVAPAVRAPGWLGRLSSRRKSAT